MWAGFGLKLTIFSLVFKTSIDIASPKFWAAGNVTKGFAYRPKTGHFTLLSRRDGKDVVSVHKRDSYVADRGWYSDTIDAQSLSWSPDGKWLAVVESAGQGHKILFYTPDGHLFRSWKGPRPSGVEEDDFEHGAGVRSIEWTKDEKYLAVADFSSKITLLSIPNFVEIMRLEHTTTIKPAQSLQVWQETVLTRAQATIAKVEQRQYNSVTAVVCPPTATQAPSSSSSASTEPKSGTTALTIDASGTLIAIRTESLPTTVFIWDIASKLLKSVLIQHAPVAKLTWHPTINELLLIRCAGEDTRGVAYSWDPSFEVPKIVDFGGQLPEARVMGKSIVRWLSSEDTEDGAEGIASLFFSDDQDAILACLGEDAEGVPWGESKAGPVDIYGQADENPLNLVDDGQDVGQEEDATIMSLSTENAGSEMDDTFDFKKSTMRKGKDEDVRRVGIIF